MTVGIHSSTTYKTVRFLDKTHLTVNGKYPPGGTKSMNSRTAGHFIFLYGFPNQPERKKTEKAAHAGRLFVIELQNRILYNLIGK